MRFTTSDSFKSWWEDQQFFGGDGCMDAAELAWDYCHEEITRLRAQLAETQKREQDLLSERKGEGVRTRRAIAEAKRKWLAEGQEPVAFQYVISHLNWDYASFIPTEYTESVEDAKNSKKFRWRYLYTHPAPAKVSDESELVHIGYTNGAQVLYCVTDESGSFYPDTENDSCIPVYMLRTHAHRLESTTNGEVTLDLIKHAWTMLKSQGGE